MNTSPDRISTSNGFTLFEIIIVVFIIGVIVTFASLSIGQHGDRYVEDEAKRLHHLLNLASEEAILRSEELSLQLTSGGYSFASLQGPKWEPIIDDPFFRERQFSDIVNVKLIVDEQEVNLGDSEQPAKIFLLSSGELTPPFTLTLKGENDVVYKIEGGITGEVKYLQPENKGS